MKTRITNLFILMPAIAVLFFACQKTDMPGDLQSNPESTGDQNLKATFVYCGQPTIVPMVEFSNPSVSYGSITVGNDEQNLYITYEASAGTLIAATDLYVGPASLIPGSINGNGVGNFDLGAFPYHSTHAYPFVTNFVYTLPLADFEDCFAVVAHAFIRMPDGAVTHAWGYQSIVRTPDGFYFNYCKQECEIPELNCETGYAYGEIYANCFLNIPGVNSNNWGWSNGPIGPGTYVWPIYAGAGQCVIDNGVYVGDLTVTYTPPTAVVTYTMLPGNVLNGAQLYVGNQILPKKNGKFTTAPGQFPYKHGELNGVVSDTFTINGLSGNIYVAAHCEACYME